MACTPRALSPFPRKRGMSPLKPPTLPRQAIGIDAVIGAELADGLGQIVAHGAGGQAELLGDLRRRQSFARQAQYLTFAVVERIGFVPRFDRQRGIDGLAAAMHAAQRL